MPNKKSSLAHSPSLIATFYGERDFDSKLTEQLRQTLMLSVNGSGEWTDANGAAFLYRFNPPAAHDTTIVQLALNADGEAARGFDSMLEKLEGSLPEKFKWKGLWGYSLVFQAELSPKAETDLAFTSCASSLRGIHSHVADGKPLGYAQPKGGYLWLLDVPLQDDGGAAASVYLAFCPPNDPDQFVTAQLYGKTASMLMPDLIAHKGYHQIRQYRTDKIKAAFDNKVHGMTDAATKILTELSDNRATAPHVKTLAGEYPPLLAAVTDLSRLRISLEKQLTNFDQWNAPAEQHAVLAYHRGHLQTAAAELDLMTAEARGALEVCRATVDMVQAELEKEQGARQQRLENMLAIFGAILALGQIFNRDLIAELLPQIIPPPPQGYSVLVLDLTQAGLVLGSTLILWLIVRWMLRSRK